MRHSNFQNKDSSFKIINNSDSIIEIWTFTLIDGLTALDSITPSAVGNYYKATISTPNVDCFMLMRIGGLAEIVRVGDPEALMVAYTGEIDQVKTYKQYDYDAAELDNASMVEIGEGFYYIEPAVLDRSFFDIEGSIITLTLPYKVINCEEGAGSGSGPAADENFVNVGFNMFGFLGERHSYFDLGQGKWINDDAVDAKASDLAKAVCHKYSLVWDDEAHTDWIGNYIKYIRSYEENAGRVRYYKPYKTPDDNAANFSLMQNDESGNLVVKGVSILLLQTLETVNSTDGATIPFREV